MVSLDNKCMNCGNNTLATDKAILYSSFKMACLQYKPSQVSYKNGTYDRNELLDVKLKLLYDLGDE